MKYSLPTSEDPLGIFRVCVYFLLRYQFFFVTQVVRVSSLRVCPALSPSLSPTLWRGTSTTLCRALP